MLHLPIGEVARRTETGFLAMIQGMNPRLPRIVV